MSNKLIAFLKQEVKLATGCTEPGAIALAAAQAAAILGEETVRLKVITSANIAKNAATVTIPNTQSRYGVGLAAALGALVAKPEAGLQLFDFVTPRHLAAAQNLLANTQVVVEVNFEESMCIEVDVWGLNHHAHIRMAGGHSNVESLFLDGKPCVLTRECQEYCGVEANVDFKSCNLLELIDFIATIPLQEISFLQESLSVNERIMDYGLKEVSGLGLGAELKHLAEQGILGDDLITRVRIAAAAACDARMAGVGLPVMSFMGSGNQGIMVSIPISVVAQEMNFSNDTFLRGLALSYLVTAMVKSHTGKLSSSCGCAVAAGVGVAAATAWMLSKDARVVQGSINNLIGNLAGLLCDGAKASCALKVSTSASEAILAALLATKGIRLGKKDGIVSDGADGTIHNLGRLTTEGMRGLDKTILNIVTSK